MNTEEKDMDAFSDSPGPRPKVSRRRWFVAGSCGGVFLLTVICVVVLLWVTSKAGDQVDVIELDSTTVATFSPEMQATVQAAMDGQARGLDGAEVTVYRAYNYRGFSWIEPVKGAKLVAIDVGLAGYSEGIDLDDIDIIDGETDENYGSDPDIVFLTDEGEPFPDNQPSQSFGEPIRVLLIYAVRESTESIKLGYWGSEIVSEPVVLEEDGLALPAP